MEVSLPWWARPSRNTWFYRPAIILGAHVGWRKSYGSTWKAWGAGFVNKPREKTSDDSPEVIREIVSPFRNLDRAIGYGCDTLWTSTYANDWLGGDMARSKSFFTLFGLIECGNTTIISSLIAWLDSRTPGRVSPTRRLSITRTVSFCDLHIQFTTSSWTATESSPAGPSSRRSQGPSALRFANGGYEDLENLDFVCSQPFTLWSTNIIDDGTWP
jgi:hypothetical protein